MLDTSMIIKGGLLALIHPVLSEYVAGLLRVLHKAPKLPKLSSNIKAVMLLQLAKRVVLHLRNRITRYAKT